MRNRWCEAELSACPGGRRQGGGRAFSPCPLPSPALGCCPRQTPGVPEESSRGAPCPAQLHRALGASWSEMFVLKHLAHKDWGSSTRGWLGTRGAAPGAAAGDRGASSQHPSSSAGGFSWVSSSVEEAAQPHCAQGEPQGSEPAPCCCQPRHCQVTVGSERQRRRR